jgi:chitodextrinase
VVLEPDTLYTLSFKAYSNTGHDLSITLQKHGSPYTNYGLSNSVVNLTRSWNTYTIQFTTTGFSSIVNDARLMFWFAPYAAAGDEYFIDDVVLAVATDDNTAPSAPSGLSASAVTASKVNLIWKASADNFGVAGYKVYRNGTQVAKVTTTAYSNTGLLPSTAYTYKVASFDAAGNMSARSTAVSIVTPPRVDSTPPSAPAGLTARAVSSKRVNLSWKTSTDNVGVAGYRIYRNGKLIATTVSTTYYDQGLLPSTAYIYKVVSFDAAGNNSVRSSVTVSTLAPVIF